MKKRSVWIAVELGGVYSVQLVSPTGRTLAQIARRYTNAAEAKAEAERRNEKRNA